MNYQNKSRVSAQPWGVSPAIGLLIVSLAAIVITFDDAVAFMVRSWRTPEFIHGPLILLAAGIMIWRRRDLLQGRDCDGSWAGVALCVCGAGLAVFGQLASLFVVTQFGALTCVYGVVLAAVGTQVFMRLWAPMLLLFFMVPLPLFLRVNLLAELQIASARIGVGLMQAAGVSVFVEHDVLDFGRYGLRLHQVGGGLGFLFPFMALALAIAYLLTDSWWKRVLVFVSSIPLIVIVNGTVLGAVVVFADRSRAESIEPFVQDFQPWVVFALSGLLLVLEALLLRGIGRDPRERVPGQPLDSRRPSSIDLQSSARRMPAASLTAATLVLIATAALSPWLVGRPEVVPQRPSFAEFPLIVGTWSGQRSVLEDEYLDVLKLDDYLLADFRRPAELPVNLYVAWYDTQRAGRSAHSPRACLPGDGWQIQEFGQVAIPDAGSQGLALRMNRVLIARGHERQLVYYYFQQRGRNVTNEYLVKWHLFWDLLTRRRSDGALVRLTVPLARGQSADAADRQLVEFLRQVTPVLERYVPR